MEQEKPLKRPRYSLEWDFVFDCQLDQTKRHETFHFNVLHSLELNTDHVKSALQDLGREN